MSSYGTGVIVLDFESDCVWKVQCYLWHLIGGCRRRVCLLVSRKLFCDEYESVKIHSGL